MTHEELCQAGHEVDAAGYARLSRFVGLLIEENRRVNLTGARGAAALWGHVCDSLALWPRVRVGVVRRVLDIGSGGGFPGLPLACVCDAVRFTLLDATRKKTVALDRIIEGLELAHVEAVWGRAEVLAHDADYRERFDLVTARAVAGLPVLIECAAGLVCVGGECWFFKTPGALEGELSQAAVAAQTCGVESLETVRYHLPDDPGERVLVGYRKQQPVPENLPRRPGRAKKRPL